MEVSLRGCCRKTCGYGPGPFFGELLVERRLAFSVGLVPCAVGGTDIDAWKEGSHLFDQMVRAFWTLLPNRNLLEKPAKQINKSLQSIIVTFLLRFLGNSLQRYYWRRISRI